MVAFHIFDSVTLRYACPWQNRGRIITREDITFIQQLIREHPGASRRIRRASQRASGAPDIFLSGISPRNWGLCGWKLIGCPGCGPYSSTRPSACPSRSIRKSMIPIGGTPPPPILRPTHWSIFTTAHPQMVNGTTPPRNRYDPPARTRQVLAIGHKPGLV